MEKPICFISLNGKNSDGTSRFVINEDAARIIESLPAPVGVISVAGLYRTGKSFILNQLAGKTNGFDIGASIEPQTQGIWMWAFTPDELQQNHHKNASSPLSMGLSNDLLNQISDDMSIVLLDTEGLGSFTKNETHDVKIFALALLLSSYLVYNSLGTIDDNAMDNISLIVELTKNIKASSESEGPQDPYTLRAFFPKFMWLLRDFSLELVMDGKEVSAAQYLENALKQLPGEGPEVDSKNRIRECVRTFFEDRTCVTLKRPVVDEDQLQNLGSLPLSEFRPEYLAEVKALIEYIYKKLARNYVEAIDTGSVPVIKNAWENVVRIQCQQAVDLAVKSYKQSMSSHFTGSLVYDESDLDAFHDLAEDTATDTFFKKIVVNGVSGSDVSGYLSEVKKAVNTMFEKYENENRERSLEVCERVWGRLISELGRVVQEDQIDNYDDLLEGYRKVLKQYDDEAKGPKKYLTFFKNSDAHIFDYARTVTDINVSLAETKATEKYDLEREKQKHEYTTLQELYKSVDSEWQKQEEASKRLRAENTDLRYELMGLQKSVKALETENKEIKGTVDELEKEKNVLSEKLKTEEEEVKKARNEVADVKRQYEVGMKEAKDALEAMTKQKQEAEEKLQKAQEESDGKCCIVM